MTALIWPAAVTGQTQWRGQVFWLHDWAPALTIGVDNRWSFGGADDFAPGLREETVHWSGRAALSLGASLADVDGELDPVAVILAAGIAHDVDLWVFDRLGVEGLGSSTPLGGGPALRVESLQKVALEIGWIWHDGTSGLLVSADIAWSLIQDIVN